MSKKQPKLKHRIQMKVSIPRAGEFIVTANIDLSGTRLEFWSKGDIEFIAADDVASRIKITPLKGEIARVYKAIQKDT